MSSLKIYASGKRVVVWEGLSHWQPDSGQFLLNFDTKHILKPARLKAPPREQPSQAEAALTWFDRAMVPRQTRGRKPGAPIRTPSDYS